jgi:uncharacterized repeat protein (TIGR02543 family)
MFGKKNFKVFLISLTLLFLSVTPLIVFGNNEEEDIDFVREHLEEKLKLPHRANAFRVQFHDEGVSQLDIRSLNHAMGNMDAEVIHRDLPGWLEGTPFENVRYIYLEEGELLDQMVDYYSNSLVASVDPVYELELVDWTTDNGRALPDDWHGTNHWYFNKIELPELWYKQGCHLGSESCGGSDEIVVAVIDTGLGFSNYTADYYDGYTYVSPNPVYAEYDDIEFGKSSEQEGVNLWVNPNPGDGICGDVHGVDMEIWNYNRNISSKDDTSPNICEQSDFAKEGQPNDDDGHGTYVSGIIASATNNGAGSVGMAHNVSIMTIKANLLFAGVFFADTLEYSIYYAVNNGADVINMSLGGGGVPPYANALDYAEAQGVVVVAASGNSGVGTVSYPAAYGSVIAVGAVNSNNSRSSYSNYGTALDFVAPVGDATIMWHQTLTCQGTGGCNEGSDLTAYSMRFGAGTSYASPQVAGAVALIKGVNKDFSASAVKNILIETVVDIGEPGKDDETGYGLLNLNNIYDYFVFNLSFDANDGEVVPLSKEVFYNEPVGTLPTPTRLGYDFVEWNTELNGSGDVYTEDTVYEILDDSTLYAQWELVEPDTPSIVKINDVPSISVKYGTSNSVARSMLASSTTIRDSNEGTHTVDLTWTIPNYDGKSPGIYNAIGVFVLPEGVIQSNPEMVLQVTTTVTVGKPAGLIAKRKILTNRSVLNPRRMKFMVTGDFRGNGRDSIAAIYDYGSSSMGIWLFDSDEKGNFATPTLAHSRPSNTWDLSKTVSFVAGDFNGNGRDDLVAMYSYSNARIRMWLFESDGTGKFGSPKLMHTRPARTWPSDRTAFLVSGDFNGNGIDDVIAMYAYRNSGMGLWLFESDGKGKFDAPELVHRRPANTWDVSNTGFLVSGDFNGNGIDDVVAMYSYRNASMRMWLFESDGKGSFSSPQVMLHRRRNTWDVSQTGFLISGDFNNNGIDDVVAMYSYRNAAMRLWYFESNPSGKLNSPRSISNWERNTWSVSRTKFMVSGDFDGNGNQDIAAAYDYGNSRMGIWVW